MARSISNFSLDCLSVEVKIHLYPFTQAAIAKPIPVFPEVHSIIVPPGFKRPSFSASSIILTAILSFIECPGLKDSILTQTKAGICAVILFSFTIGVLPMVSSMLLKIRITAKIEKILKAEVTGIVIYPSILTGLLILSCKEIKVSVLVISSIF